MARNVKGSYVAPPPRPGLPPLRVVELLGEIATHGAAIAGHREEILYIIKSNWELLSAPSRVLLTESLIFVAIADKWRAVNDA
ncbi:MAG: hypothetical protein ACRDYC_04730 [Acidimicrobiales bacterium]